VCHFRLRCARRESVDLPAQAFDRALVGQDARTFRQQRIEQREQGVAPLRRRHRAAQQAFVAREHAQDADQRIERVE
jgi:hypothetical protein